MAKAQRPIVIPVRPGLLDPQAAIAQGVAEFGSLWVGLNEKTVDLALSFGLNPADPGTKQFLILLTLRLSLLARQSRPLGFTDHPTTPDPTHNADQIKANPVWRVAFVLSECLNPNAPLGWGKYIWVAEAIVKR